MKWLIALFVLLLLMPLARGQVIDGDTIKFNGTTYRLHGIDAPELRQDCLGWPAGALAKTALELMTQGRKIECEPRTTDRYGRTVALCRADGMDIGAAMVSLGLAWAYTRYSAQYIDQEAFARRNVRGVWAYDCKPAWEYRAEKR